MSRIWQSSPSASHRHVDDPAAHRLQHLHDLAWYGHLKYESSPLWKVILVSWAIAFFEYCLQVPANRIESKIFFPDQLKVIQEVVTLSVFSVFYFGDRLHWNHLAAFSCLVAATDQLSGAVAAHAPAHMQL